MRHQVVHNRGHGFSKRLNPAGVYNFLPTRTNRLLTPHVTSSFGGWQRVDGSLYSCVYLSMIHQVRATGAVPSGRPLAAPSHSPTRYPSGSQLITATSHFDKSSNSHPNGNIELEAPWIDVHTLVVDRITHSLQRVVCTLGLGS